MSFAVRITTASGGPTTHPLVASQTTVGSDALADIQVTGEASILPQHILLAPSADACWVSTAPGSPLWDKHGAAVAGSYVAWGTRLTVGRCAFELIEQEGHNKMPAARNSATPNPDKAGELDNSRSALVHPGLLMLLIVTLVYTTLQGFPPSDSLTASGFADVPALFEDMPASCRGENPRHRAIALEEQALAKSERAVFDLQDGVEAAFLYREAHHCFALSGQVLESEYVLELEGALRASLEEQYNLLQLRLSRDVSSNNKASAQLQVRRLTELLKHKADTRYGLSLRRLSARLAKQGSTL